jgi:serine protease Do
MRVDRFILALLATVCLIFAKPASAMEEAKIHQNRGCPDLIDLIKDITPVVVSISIERAMVEKSSSEPHPLFKAKTGVYDEKKLREKVQTDSLGSGFFADQLGHIVTNAHVIEGASKILVTLPDGRIETAKMVAVHPKVDLALIKIDTPQSFQKARIADATSVQVGEWVLAVGNPFGLGRTVTVGIVSGKGRFLGLGPDDNFIQTDAAINPGNSGGPLFNMAGEVIGVNTAIIASGKGIGFSIPSNYVVELLKSPGASDSNLRGWLGIYVEDISNDRARKLGMNSPRGAVVDEVLNTAPAYAAGLRKGDLILDADGKQIRNGGHLSKIVAGAKPGDVLKMRILRGKTPQMFEVVIGKSPE